MTAASIAPDLRELIAKAVHSALLIDGERLLDDVPERIEGAPLTFCTLKESCRLVSLALPAAFAEANPGRRATAAIVLLGQQLASGTLVALVQKDDGLQWLRVPFSLWEGAFHEALTRKHDLGDLGFTVIRNALCGSRFGELQGLMPIVPADRLGEFIKRLADGVIGGESIGPQSDKRPPPIHGRKITAYFADPEVEAVAVRRIEAAGGDPFVRQALLDEFHKMLTELGQSHSEASLDGLYRRALKRRVQLPPD